MTSTKVPRAVLVTRPTQYEELRARHGTHQHARFFLAMRDQQIEPVLERHRAFEDAQKSVLAAIPLDWRRSRVTRGDLDRFLFEPDDVVLALGQDGLVANVAKYLSGQPVIGFDPEPDRNPGVLVPHPPEAAADLLSATVRASVAVAELTMVEARLDDGQSLVALNEVFIGHRTHQSARYHIEFGGRRERQSSSGLIFASGTGSTGWARSIHQAYGCADQLPGPTEQRAVFFVREAWPSVATGTELTRGSVGPGESLHITSRMDGDGVVFGDGIEADHLDLPWGARLDVVLSDRSLRLVGGPARRPERRSRRQAVLA